MKKENPIVNLLLNIVLPVIILTKFNKESLLGPKLALIIGLGMPFCYGLYAWIVNKKFNATSIIGLVSILLTVVIGGLEFNKTSLVIKETSIPLLLAFLVLYSKNKKWSIGKTILRYIVNTEDIIREYSKINAIAKYESMEFKFNRSIAFAFVLSAILNFLLAVIMIQSEPGSTSYVSEIGKMTAISLFVISIPVAIVLFYFIHNLIGQVQKDTGLDLDEILVK